MGTTKFGGTKIGRELPLNPPRVYGPALHNGENIVRLLTKHIAYITKWNEIIAACLHKRKFTTSSLVSHAVLKVLNCEIGFQDLENVLNLAKMYLKY